MGEQKKPVSKVRKNIKEIHERTKMSRGDICRAVGFDRVQMSNIETDKENPTLTTTEKIA